MLKKIMLRIIVPIGVLGLMILGGITLLEYNPKPEEDLMVLGEGAKTELSLKMDYTVSTFNIGYGAFSEEEDFFMDGGTTVRPKEKRIVENNMAKIKEELHHMDSDFVFIQEVDQKSKRSYHINQVDQLITNDLEGTFAYNFKVRYVPYPFPPIGEVGSGILTMGKFQIKEAKRISLPNPFSWPIKTVNLKRAMQVTRYGIEGTSQEFVLINFHLEAFDSGEGKKEQTKMVTSLILEEYEKGNYVVAGGDWNQTLLKDWVEDENLLTQWKPGVMDWDELPHWEMGVDQNTPTNRSLIKPYKGNENSLAKFFIDGFIVSPNVKIQSTQVNPLNYKYSDHEPVTMRFTLD